jgi:hypothetical protein
MRSSIVMCSSLAGTVKNLSCLGFFAVGCHLLFTKVAMDSGVRSFTWMSVWHMFGGVMYVGSNHGMMSSLNVPLRAYDVNVAGW